MSAVIVLAPVIIGGWPVISAAVTAAVATMGFTAVRSSSSIDVFGQARSSAKVHEELEVDNAEILSQSLNSEEKIIVERDGVIAVFSRDARGSLKLCLEGVGLSKAELRNIGQELIDRVTQQYVYNRIVTELKERKMVVVDEEVAEDRTVTIRVRNS